MQVVPCGNCIGCRAEQSRQWAVRMMHETRMHALSSQFVTLTIDDEHQNENCEISPRDLSGFFKDLRKADKEQQIERNGFVRPISYYGCGEYGERTGRAHYHALLFGVEFLDRDFGFDHDRPDVWRSETLSRIWGRGNCEGGAVTMGSASYVSGYMRKKVKRERYERANRTTGVLMQPEFARMSLRPAIGRRWIKKYWRDVYPRDYVVVDGIEAKPPRYYDKYMDLEDNKGGSEERRAMMDGIRDRRFAEQKEMTKYQLMSGEKIHQARTELFQRRNRI